MASSHSHGEPSLQHLESSIEQHISNCKDVNSITQFPMAASGDSQRTTFICQTDSKIRDNSFFPRAEHVENIMKNSENVSWNNLRNYLKSQCIVNNIEIFRKWQNRPNVDLNSKQFPLAKVQLHMEYFPLTIPTCCNLNNHSPKNVIKFDTLLYPLKSNNQPRMLPCKRQILKGQTFKEFRNRRSSMRHSNLKHIWRRKPSNANFKRFTNSKISARFHNHKHKQARSNKMDFRFPLKPYENKSTFPFLNKSRYKTNFYFLNRKQEFGIPMEKFSKCHKDPSHHNSIIKFPCKVAVLSCLSKFPINTLFTQHEHFLNDSFRRRYKVNMSKNPHTLNYLPSLAMTLADYEMKSTENGHMSQVQDARADVEDITRSSSIQNKDEHATPRISTNSNKTDDDDVNILAGINTIDNFRLNEVGYYTEKIERLQDVIIALFERIQNFFSSNHNSEEESTNAAKLDHGDINNRFAPTPPTSVTSVQNRESNNNDKEGILRKCDLRDLCDLQHGQIVECSDVRDTLTELVDYGQTKQETNSADSFLVKSEEITSPNSLIPNLLNESKQKSRKLCDYTTVSELLIKNTVSEVNETINITDSKYSFELNPNNTSDTEKASNEFSEFINETNLNARENNLAISITGDMTISQLKPEANTNISVKKNLKRNTNYTLSNNSQIHEMKYEMNRVKGDLPNSVSERSLAKYDKDKLLTNPTRLAARNTGPPSSNKKLPYSCPRNNNGSSFCAPGSSVKNEIVSFPLSTGTKLSPLNTQMLKADAPHLSDTTNTNRSTLSSAAPPSSMFKSDTASYRRPSSTSLRNTQPTFAKSADLPRTLPLPAVGSSDKVSLPNRAVSMDSSVLPERTILRRLRRLRTQNSKDEPEDPTERLNILKARISASLSEVKGVLKQYSTEAENDDQTENQPAPAKNIISQTKEEENKEGPITFRFVKKVRRRSLFAVDDELEQKESKMDTETSAESPKEESQLKTKDEVDKSKPECESTLTLPRQSSGNGDVSKENTVEKKIEATEVAKQPTSKVIGINVDANLYTLKEETEKHLKDTRQNESTIPIEEKQPVHRDETPEIKETGKGAIHMQEKNILQIDSTHEVPKKTKKKIIIKSKEPTRRASLAAVEAAKIEPQLRVAMQRRPSDSGTVIKKKQIFNKLNTSGIAEEGAPQTKIVKVRKSSIKSDNNSLLAAEKSKLKEVDTTANAKSDDLIKPRHKDNKSIHADDENEDGEMPKQPEAERLHKINREITSQTNLLLPTQLVIDEAASLNEKTIENSMLPPRQQHEQQQRQQQRQRDQQATINSTATNFISDHLQSKGAMLENLTSVLSSSIASKANGQVKCENVVPQENFHDLLQQETAIVKPSATVKQQVTSNESNVQVNVEGVKNQLKEQPEKEQEQPQPQPQPQQQQQTQQQTSSEQHQQPIPLASVAHAQSCDNSNTHEHIKAKLSPKEPCQDKTTTSIHAEANHKQRVGEQSITNADHTKTVSSPHISISSTSDFISKTTTESLIVPSESVVEKKTEASANQENAMPELKLAYAPVQTADIISHPELHKKKNIIKKIVPQSSTDKNKKIELEKNKSLPETEQFTNKLYPDKSQIAEEVEIVVSETKSEPHLAIDDVPAQIDPDQSTDECSESADKSESCTCTASEDVTATHSPKERKVKKKVIIKRQKRRLSLVDNFFQRSDSEDQQDAEIETIEKPIAYFTDDETDQSEKKDEPVNCDGAHEEVKPPLKSCILHKEYNIGDEVLYAERFKKTQIKWRRGRIKERITSISYLLDIDGKDVSSHINYLKRYTGRKVSFVGKEYLEIDYEQLAEEEERAERLQKRSYSIWNMV